MMGEKHSERKKSLKHCNLYYLIVCNKIKHKQLQSKIKREKKKKNSVFIVSDFCLFVVPFLLFSTEQINLVKLEHSRLQFH
jgi:heme/copper-type cytochrome/quinol oxidase subunit 3